MELTTKKCAALECTVAVSSDWLMCKRHWKMVPAEIQEDVWDAQRAGDKARMLETASEAANAVQTREIEVGQRCRSCGATIFFATCVRSQRPIPIDTQPTADGNLMVRGGKKSTQLYAKKVDAKGVVGEKRDGADLYTCHFATCPQANEWRAHNRRYKITNKKTGEVGSLGAPSLSAAKKAVESRWKNSGAKYKLSDFAITLDAGGN